LLFLLALAAIDGWSCGTKILFTPARSNAVTLIGDRFDKMLAGLVTFRLGVNFARIFHADGSPTSTFGDDILQMLTSRAVGLWVWGANDPFACLRYTSTFIFVFPHFLTLAALRSRWSWAYFFRTCRLSDATALIRRRNDHIVTRVAHLRGIHFTLFHFARAVKAAAFIAIRLFYLAICAVDRWLHRAYMRLAFQRRTAARVRDGDYLIAWMLALDRRRDWASVVHAAERRAIATVFVLDNLLTRGTFGERRGWARNVLANWRQQALALVLLLPHALTGIAGDRRNDGARLRLALELGTAAAAGAIARDRDQLLAIPAFGDRNLGTLLALDLALLTRDAALLVKNVLAHFHLIWAWLRSFVIGADGGQWTAFFLRDGSIFAVVVVRFRAGSAHTSPAGALVLGLQKLRHLAWWTGWLRTGIGTTLALGADHVLSGSLEALENSVLTDVQLLEPFFALILFVERTRASDGRVRLALHFRFAIFTLDANATRIFKNVSLIDPFSIFKSTAIAISLWNAFALFVPNETRGTLLRNASFNTLTRFLVALVIIVQVVKSVGTTLLRFQRDASIVARTLRRCILRLTGTLDGAEFLASPASGHALFGAEFGVDGDGGAKAFALAAKVARTRVVHAPLEIRSRVHHGATGGEHGPVHHATFLLGVGFLLIGGALVGRFWQRRFAFVVGSPFIGEFVRLCERASAVAGSELVAVVVVKVATKSCYFVFEDPV